MRQREAAEVLLPGYLIQIRVEGYGAIHQLRVSGGIAAEQGHGTCGVGTDFLYSRGEVEDFEAAAEKGLVAEGRHGCGECDGAQCRAAAECLGRQGGDLGGAQASLRQLAAFGEDAGAEGVGGGKGDAGQRRAVESPVADAAERGGEGDRAQVLGRGESALFDGGESGGQRYRLQLAEGEDVGRQHVGGILVAAEHDGRVALYVHDLQPAHIEAAQGGELSGEVEVAGVGAAGQRQGGDGGGIRAEDLAQVTRRYVQGMQRRRKAKSRHGEDKELFHVALFISRLQSCRRWPRWRLRPVGS